MAKSETIAFTADIVLFAHAAGAWHVLLIERGHDPYAGRLALPGGYVDPGETSRAAAARELWEETSLAAPPVLHQIGAYDEPGRDPRGRVVSVAYVAVLSQMPAPVAGDDAATAQWVAVQDLVDARAMLAFDHAEILSDALEWASISAPRSLSREA